MKIFSASEVSAALPWDALINAIRTTFAEGSHQPLRNHFRVGSGDLLLMPAWTDGGFIGVKLVTVFPENAQRDLPSVASFYVLFDAATGLPLAQLDGGPLTARRTAASSVLAATYLARKDSRVLGVFGTGKVSRGLVEAYAATFPLETILLCGRDPERTRAAARELAHVPGVVAAPAERLFAEADILSAATLSRTPIITGDRLRPGVHVDLVGAYRPDMRESDDRVMSVADVIFVDTREGGLTEAGDIVQAMASGAISEATIAGTLAELCRREHPGRRSEREITVFKSVGASCEDLAAAALVYRRMAATTGTPA